MVTQEARTERRRAHGAAVAVISAAAAIVAAAAVILAGCGQRHFVGLESRPGEAPCVYWVWPGLDIAQLLSPPASMTPRWNEFLDASREHSVLVYDFLYFEGHPEAVDPAWKQNLVPEVTKAGWLHYTGAGRWHAADAHFSPDAVPLYYLHLPAGRAIDNADDEVWRFPVGTELVQLLYHRRSEADQTADLVEWRRMRAAGPGRGQMRTDGTRSDWVFESAVRDPADGLWRRTRDDGHDARWQTLGPSKGRFRWPVIRPHACAECHRLAGRSPFDGPRGGSEVYSLGDLREAAWAGQTEALADLLRRPPWAEGAQAAAREPRPPDPAERYADYIEHLARQRSEPPAITRSQQRLIDESPLAPDDPEARRRGREIYLTQCAGCHGADARGHGPLALRTPAPPSLVGLRPTTILKTMRGGRDNMPAWNGVLPGDEQWRLIEYLKTTK